MSALKIGSLCSGYGGLDLAIEQFFGAETAWFSEFEAAPSKVLAHHWPGVPNLGDMTAIDWATVEPVDIIAGGTPCQDLSAAGRRRGMTEGTRSNLWVQMREAIAVIRPSIVIWENVRGAYSARAASDVEHEEGLLGKSTGGPALRALGRVLGDLSDLGFDAEVVGLRAADAGAPHGRFRVFVLAYAAGVGRGEGWAESARVVGRSDDAVGGASSAEDTDRTVGDQRRIAAPGQEAGGRSRADVGGSDRTRTDLTLLPTPAAHDSGNTPEAHLRKKPGRSVVTSLQVMADHGLIPSGGRLFSTPDTVPEAPNKGTNSNMTMGLGNQVMELLQTPVASEGHKATFAPFDEVSGSQEFLTNQIASVHRDGTWGPYAEAIARWEAVMGRPAPAPTLPDGKAGKHRLNARLVEWMMGQQDGWVTAPEIGLTRNEQLKALGNGVVTQQAELAFSIAWSRVLEQVAA